MHYSRWARNGDPVARRHVKTVGLAFDDLVDRSGGPDACWPWRGPLDEQGYGRWRQGGVDERAHREAYRRAVGEPPAGQVLDHRCHVPGTCSGGPSCPHRSCCNWTHLLPVTNGENAGRSSRWTPQAIGHA